ncbi:MAG: hypothetical protein V7K18_19280 [Nostoc sp.]|uniref:hypothetical protein n=1 Tax=Nostoc sp. TaxID=1180 RepID=UPI002FFC82DF
MTKIISQAEYQEKWHDCNKNLQYPDPLDSSDIIYSYPQQFAIGYERWIELPDINLLIINKKYYNDLQIVSQADQDEFEEIVEFGFNLSGSYSLNRLDGTCNRGGGESFLQWDFFPGE